MFALVFSLLFVLIAAVCMLFGALRGRKYKWQFSLTDIVAVIVSVILSAFLASVIANVTAGFAVNKLLDSGVLSDVGDVINDLPSGVETVRALAAILAAPVLFILLFIIVKALFKFVGRCILLLIVRAPQEDSEESEDKKVERKHFKKRYAPLVANHFNPVGAVLGALCSFLVFCSFLIPLYGAVENVSDVAPVALNSVKENDTSGAVQIASDVIDGMSGNVGSATITCLGGKGIYSIITTSTINGESLNLNRECYFFASVADAAFAVLEEDTDPTVAAASMRAVSPAFDKSVITRTLASEFFSKAGSSWNEGKTYFGIARPEFGGVMKPLMNSLIDVLATSDKENIKKDVKAVTDAAAIVIEAGVIDNIKDDPLAILSKEETTALILEAFFADERLDPLIDGISDFGINALMASIDAPSAREVMYDALVRDFVNGARTYDDVNELERYYVDLFDDYGLTVDAGLPAVAANAGVCGIDMEEYLRENVVADKEDFVRKTVLVSADMVTDGTVSITDRSKEAKALAHAFSVVYDIMGDLNGNNLDIKTLLGGFGAALDSFAATETVGYDKAADMLTAVLQAPSVHDQIGFNVIEATDAARSIGENAKTDGFASVMRSLSGVVEMLEAASDSGKDTKEAVSKMLEDLTPEAASVMQTMSTPNVMKNYGVPEKSADAAAEMVSNTFGNLKDVPAEDYDKEAAAVADMMNLMMSVTSSDGNSSVFGGEDSSAKVTEEEYVDNAMNSTAISKTLVDTVYGEGNEPKVDPLNSGNKLNDTEKANLLTTLNTKWNESEKDEQTEKKIVSIAAMANLSVKITENGVEEAVARA